MPRAYRHLTWRVNDPIHDDDSSMDSRLQTLVRGPGPKHTLSWMTVARGNGYDLTEIAKALNRARFTLGDISPVKSKSSTEKRR